MNVWFERWMAKLPLPLTPTDRDAGFWWDLSMRQIETSRTLVLDDDCHARSFFEASWPTTWTWAGQKTSNCCSAAAPERAGPPIHPRAAGSKQRSTDTATWSPLNVFYKNSRCKQSLKDGVALRIETVINDARDLRCNRLLTNLDELQAKARAINNQLLETETVGQGTALVSPVIERITKPTVTNEGRKAPALRFGDLRVQALAGALANMLFAVTGITNKHLRVLMTGLLHRPYSINQASYDLARLTRNGLIQRIPNRNQYILIPDGHLFAQIYTKVHDRVLRPLMAPDQPNAAPKLRHALDTIDRIVTQRITHARVPTTT